MLEGIEYSTLHIDYLLIEALPQMAVLQKKGLWSLLFYIIHMKKRNQYRIPL